MSSARTRMVGVARNIDRAHSHVLSYMIGDIIFFHADSFKATEEEDDVTAVKAYRLLELADFFDFFLVLPQMTIVEENVICH